MLAAGKNDGGGWKFHLWKKKEWFDACWHYPPVLSPFHGTYKANWICTFILHWILFTAGRATIITLFFGNGTLHIWHMTHSNTHKMEHVCTASLPLWLTLTKVTKYMFTGVGVCAGEMEVGSNRGQSFLLSLCKGWDAWRCGFVSEAEWEKHDIRNNENKNRACVFLQTHVCLMGDKARAAAHCDWFPLRFPSYTSSKGDMVGLNRIKKAQPWQCCNQKDQGKRNDDVNATCCICTFIYCPFPVLWDFRHCEGSLHKPGWVTGQRH